MGGQATLHPMTTTASQPQTGSAPTTKEVAEWLLATVLALVEERRRAYQSTVVRLLKDKFGPDWVYMNGNGNLAISRAVLAAFRKLDGWSLIEWDRSDQSWVKKKP